jgi:gamma-glutamylcyclotransferase (GGCT)/AIG2-like uncharacterized protein YtfP
MKASDSKFGRCRILLFAYGTLLDAKVQRRVFGREVVVTPARVNGWQVKQRLVRGRYPGIVATPRASTPGGVLKITAAELRRADAYEDAPQLYQRVRLAARVGAKRVRCWAYVPTNLSSIR